MPGIGPINATALVAAVGDASAFSRARDLAAWLGPVPKQATKGGKPRQRAANEELIGATEGDRPGPRDLRDVVTEMG